tara:strand:- start:58 stop:222 length:165 start_codon:yes stop_codon:yes gene_type:complete
MPFEKCFCESTSKLTPAGFLKRLLGKRLSILVMVRICLDTTWKIFVEYFQKEAD